VGISRFPVSRHFPNPETLNWCPFGPWPGEAVDLAISRPEAIAGLDKCSSPRDAK
jgi:hypothetical protein